jgi:hypothetical protein
MLGGTDNGVSGNTANGGNSLIGGAIPGPTGQWGQASSFGPGISNIVNPMETGAAGAASSFNPGNNPTWQGPNPGNVSAINYNAPTAADAAALKYGGPQNAGALSFNPAETAKGLYTGAESLLEPGMQTQSNALDQSLKAMGFDTTGPGGAQTAENNLNTQQNQVRSQLAGWAEGQAIPQGAQALQAQESIPQVQQEIAKGAYGAGLQGLTEGGMLGGQQFQDLLSQIGMGGNIGQAQFGAGVTSQQLPIQEAQGLLSGAESPAGLLPGGSANVPGMTPVDVTGPAQQNFANQASIYNSNQAAGGSLMSGLGQLASSGMLAYLLMA